jgi:hypothetical protein
MGESRPRGFFTANSGTGLQVGTLRVMTEGTQLEVSVPEASPDITRVPDWLFANKIRIIGILMIGAQIRWMAAFLSRSFFRLDDFYFLERALSNGLTWKYLMWVNAGHLTPVGFAISWLLVRISPMDWTLTSAVTLAMLAWAGLALLRVLRTLFGDHPGILLLLLIYLVSPLSFPGLSWWSVTLEILPLEIAMFSALNSHVKYLRSGKFRYAAITAIWLFVGLASSIKGAGTPVLLFAITSAWQSDGLWVASIRRTLREHWRAWLSYIAVLGSWIAIYAIQLQSSNQKPVRPGAFSGVFGYMRELITSTFVPGVLGGPWNWFTAANWTSNLAVHGEYGVANPPVDLVRFAWVVAVAVILISIWQRPRSWRFWVILLAWLVAFDSIPELLGRAVYLPTSLLAHETRYVMDAVGVLVICLGLCFLPMSDQQVTKKRRLASGRPLITGIVSLAIAVLIGSVVSYHSYLANTSSKQARSYFATAQAALSAAPSNAVVWDEPAPAYVTDGFYGSVASATKLLGPLRPSDGKPPFVSVPVGTIDGLYTFNGWGQLVPVVLLGAGNVPKPASEPCFPQQNGVTTVQLGSYVSKAKITELRFGYLTASSTVVVVTYGGQARSFELLKGLHSGWLPVRGQHQRVTFINAGRRVCIGDVEAGVLFPSASSAGAIPAQRISS